MQFDTVQRLIISDKQRSLSPRKSALIVDDSLEKCQVR